MGGGERHYSHSTLNSPLYFCKDSPKLDRFAEPQCFALKAKCDDLRLNSSSGGAFSLIAEYVLSRGGVVFGASFDENLNVIHRFIEKPEQLELLRRSKYVESFIGDSYKKAKEFLKAGRLVLFSGVQCQIHGLNSFLRKPYENLISVELPCDSVPSSRVWEIYKESLELELGEKLIDFNFRGKDFGWENAVFAIKTKTKTKTKTIPHYEDIFLMNFLNHTITRKSCANCYSKGFVSGADMLIGDFWGVRKYHADFVDDKGVSCIVVHNTKALDIINSISNLCFLEQSNLEAVSKVNFTIIKSCDGNPRRDFILHKFLSIYDKTHNATKAIKFLKRLEYKNTLSYWRHLYKTNPTRRKISNAIKTFKKQFITKFRGNQ